MVLVCTYKIPDSSVGKESTYNAGDPVPDSWVGKICWRRDRVPNLVFSDFPCGSAGEESAYSAGDLGLIPGLGRSPGEGKGYSLQYSGLENSMDSIVHGVTKSQTGLSDFHFHLSCFMLWVGESDKFTYLLLFFNIFGFGLHWWLRG